MSTLALSTEQLPLIRSAAESIAPMLRMAFFARVRMLLSTGRQ
jgi:hypothetical protein